MYDNNDDGWCYYCWLNGEDIAEEILFFLKLFFFGLPVAIMAYELGRYIYDINIFKWGLVLLSLVFSFKVIGGTIVNLTYKMVDFFDNDTLRTIAALLSIVTLSVLSSYALAKFGMLFPPVALRLRGYIENYEQFFAWLVS
jgi:hypothetical protein